MNWLFKKSKALFWAILIVGMLIATAFCIDITVEGRQILPPFGIAPLGFTWAIVSFVILYVLSSVVAGRYERKLLRRIDALLVDECDPYSCIAEYEKILPRSTSNMRTYVLLELCGGYLSAGNAETAKKHLETVTSFPKNKARNASYRFVHHSNMLSFHILTGDLDSAADHLEQMKEILDDGGNGLGEMTRGQLNSHYNSQLYILNVANGVFEGAEEVFLKNLNEGTSRLSTVASRCRLGKVYLHYNRLDEAREAFEYVIENGNKTHHVTEAKELLELINQ